MERGPWYYLALLGLIAAGLALIWHGLRRLTPVGNAAARASACFQHKPALARWAILLVAVGGSLGTIFVWERHSQLLISPQRSSITGSDGSFYYFWLRSVMVDGDVDFTNDLLYCNTMEVEYRVRYAMNAPRTPTGLLPNKYPIGWALVETPWYGAAALAARAINTCGGHVIYDGWGPVYQTFLMLGQVVYAGAGLWFAYRILSEFVSPAAATCGVIIGWLGSALFYYQTVELAMSHNTMFFAAAGAFWATQRLRRDPTRLRYWFFVGLLSALVILARYQGAVWLLFPVVVCLQTVWANKRHVGGLVIAMVAGALPLALQAIAWKALYGSFFLYTYQGEGFDWAHPHLWQILFSPWHGWFNWHPLMLIGSAAFVGWAVRNYRRVEAGCFALSFALTIYLNAAWGCWWFGFSFGARAFENCTLLAMLGLAYLLQALARRGIALHATILLLLLAGMWNMNLVQVLTWGHLSGSDPVTWRQRLDSSWNYWAGVP